MEDFGSKSISSSSGFSLDESEGNSERATGDEVLLQHTQPLTVATEKLYTDSKVVLITKLRNHFGFFNSQLGQSNSVRCFSL